jgi:hypothetical protein
MPAFRGRVWRGVSLDVKSRDHDADCDADAALVLHRSVGDQIDKQMERLDAVIAQEAS